MTTEHFELVAFEEPPHPVLVEWLEDVPALIAGLALQLPAGMRLDLSRESLVELNAFVLARFPDKRSARADDELTRDLVIRLAVYLAEAWLRRTLVEIKQTRLRDLAPLCEHCHHDLHEGHATLRLRDGRLIDENGWVRPQRE